MNTGWLRNHTSSRQEIADLLGIVNRVEYDRIGATSDGEVMELIEFVDELRADVLVWLKKNHPALCAVHV